MLIMPPLYALASLKNFTGIFNASCAYLWGEPSARRSVYFKVTLSLYRRTDMYMHVIVHVPLQRDASCYSAKKRIHGRMNS